MSNNSVLISKEKWLQQNDFNQIPPIEFICLWKEYERQTLTLMGMAESAINRPVVLKTMEDADVIEQRQQYNRAIELLEACSEHLFMIPGDYLLEDHVDTFLKEVKP